MNSETTAQLVLNPSVNFDAMQRSLASLSWQRQEPATTIPSLVPGEPEQASWILADRTARLSYSFNPVVKLRVMSFGGANFLNACQTVAKTFPLLTVEDVATLLESNDVRQLLLGLYAAAELKAIDLMPRIQPLSRHEDEYVSTTALEVISKLSQQAAGAGFESLFAAKAGNRNKSVLFSQVGNFWDRRQILRWIAADNDTANDDILDVIRTALEDDDWEIRITAVLAAARLGAMDLGRRIRQVPLPTTSREGLDREHRELLVAIRKAAVAVLSGDIPAVGGEASPVTRGDRKSMWNHIHRCVAGRAVALDRVSTFIRSLIEPLHDSVDPMEPTPIGLEKREGRYFFADTDHQLSWVAPVPHLLGYEDAGTAQDPIRVATAERGFFISTRPLTETEFGLVKTSSNAADPVWQATWPATAAFVDNLRDRYGANVDLPGIGLWEMAARGPDGRRHPWGNGLQRNWRSAASPWGLLLLFSGNGDWVETDDRMPAIAGGNNARLCAVKERDPAQDRTAAVRITVSY